MEPHDLLSETHVGLGGCVVRSASTRCIWRERHTRRGDGFGKSERDNPQLARGENPKT
jgi:hypothetical protein